MAISGWVVYGGLTRIRNGQFARWSEKDGLPSNNIWSIYEDDEGILWIGTYDGGLARFKNGKFTSYSVKDGLFDDGVFRILEDSHWLLLDKLQSRCLPGKETRPECICLTRADDNRICGVRKNRRHVNRSVQWGRMAVQGSRLTTGNSGFPLKMAWQLSTPDLLPTITLPHR